MRVGLLSSFAAVRRPSILILAILLLSLGASSGASAQQGASPCSSTQHRQFDFWVGDWEVTNAAGHRAGINRIQRVLNGCVLQESWSGTGGLRGHSLSAWDSGELKWRQTWVDNTGTVLLISGGLVNNEMVMEGERRLADGSKTLERVTWTPRPDGTVRQLWQSSANQGMRWTTVFDGIYKRARF